MNENNMFRKLDRFEPIVEVFYRQLKWRNQIKNDEIKKLSSDVKELKYKVNILLCFGVASAKKLENGIAFLEKNLDLVKEDQVKVNKAVAKNKFTYSDCRVSGDEYEGRSADDEYYFYSKEYNESIKKSENLRAAMYQKIEELKKIISKEEKILSNKSLDQLKKSLCNSK